MDRVPLYLVNGAGYGASLLEAKLIAQAELFRLFQDDWESALIDPALNRLADTADAEQLASELCSWPSSIGMQPSDDVIERLRSLQEAVALEVRRSSSRPHARHTGIVRDVANAARSSHARRARIEWACTRNEPVSPCNGPCFVSIGQPKVPP